MPETEHAYKRLLGRNISADRGRLQLNQTAVAARMRALGFEDWHQQTVARIEKGQRRLTVEELFGLALALDSTVQRLLAPIGGDLWVQLPSGSHTFLHGMAVVNQVNGKNDGTITWHGNKPAQSPAGPPELLADADWHTPAAPVETES